MPKKSQKLIIFLRNNNHNNPNNPNKTYCIWGNKILQVAIVSAIIVFVSWCLDKSCEESADDRIEDDDVQTDIVGKVRVEDITEGAQDIIAFS